jgi:hypothetical protein
MAFRAAFLATIASAFMLSSTLTTNHDVQAGNGTHAVVCRSACNAQYGNRKWYYGYRLSAISYRLSAVGAVRDGL